VSSHVNIEAQRRILVRALSNCCAWLHIQCNLVHFDIALFLTVPRCLPQRDRSSLVLRRGINYAKLSPLNYDAPVAQNVA
jgi:hypothetical protein